MDLTPNLSNRAREDYELVKAANRGEEKAYAELLERYRDAIFFMLFKMINNKSDAEDLTIEAFGKAFKSIDQYSPSFAFSTWLFKIASNNCIDFIRKRKSTQYPLANSGDDLHGETDNSYINPVNILASDVPDPEEEMIRQQQAKILHTIVKKLKPRYRKLVELRYFEEYSYEEIANELELPLGTVKAQLFRARELLYNIIRNSGEHI